MKKPLAFPRLKALKDRHTMLSHLIENEMSHPAADETLVKLLKREKLKIKELLTREEARAAVS